MLDNMADWPAFNQVYVTYFRTENIRLGARSALMGWRSARWLRSNASLMLGSARKAGNESAETNQGQRRPPDMPALAADRIDDPAGSENDAGCGKADGSRLVRRPGPGEQDCCDDQADTAGQVPCEGDDEARQRVSHHACCVIQQRTDEAALTHHRMDAHGHRQQQRSESQCGLLHG
jgi:hypothetical protein